MPVQIEKLPNEPIIHCIISGAVTADDISHMFERCAELAHEIPGRIYRLTEVRETRASFFDIMLVLRQMGRDCPGATADPRFYGVLAGTSDNARFVAESSHQSQFKNLNVPLFHDFNSALNHLRAKIYEDTRYAIP